ncbi:MAG: hypothetical protein K2K44_02490, partial [Oscillospiraceae bacterium]|nr:hypothetical protein [Oscillospiraceae bacterium]
VPTTLAETATEITEAETETETTTTTAETTSETTEATTTVTETEKVCTCESEFQHACCEYLNGLDFLTGGVYYGDINGDNKPEAVVEINPFEWTYVLYENEKGMHELSFETVSQWGDVTYVADTKQILFTPMFGHTTGTWGLEEHYIYSWNGTDYEVTEEIKRESGYPLTLSDGEVWGDYSDGFINGEFVEYDTFEARVDEIEAIRMSNSYFPVIDVADENFESYVKENFPCFNNWDIVSEPKWR